MQVLNGVMGKRWVWPLTPALPAEFLCFLIEEDDENIIVVALYFLLSVFLILPRCLGNLRRTRWGQM